MSATTTKALASSKSPRLRPERPAWDEEPGRLAKTVKAVVLAAVVLAVRVLVPLGYRMLVDQRREQTIQRHSPARRQTPRSPTTAGFVSINTIKP